MPQLKTEIKDNIEIVHFYGNLDIRNSETVKKMMLEYKPQKNNIKIILKNTDNIDLSFLQLMFAFIKKLKEKGKSVEFSQELEMEYEKIVKESGFLNAFEKLIKQ